MNEWATWEMGKRLEKTAAALRKNGFTAEVLPDAEAMAARVMELAKEAATVGFGGSVTVMGAGLPVKLAEAGKECLIHTSPGLSMEERLAVMRRQLTSDLFLTGANAVTLDGKIVNIDATGNRVGAMSFGPKRVVIVAGANKMTDNVEAALKRVKALSAPPNSKRLSLETPCATTGFCSDCDSPQRICRIVHVMEKRPRVTEITVLLVAEPLGL